MRVSIRSVKNAYCKNCLNSDLFFSPCRYLLEDWSGSIMTSLCPVATHSATSRQNSSVSNSAWDGSSVLIKVCGWGGGGGEEGLKRGESLGFPLLENT